MIAMSGLRRCSALLVFLLSLITFPSIPAALTVEWQDGRLSVSAERTPLVHILQEIARRTGMEIRSLEALREPVSIRFAGLPLHEGLQQLPVHSILVWQSVSPGDQRPVLALVCGRGAPASQPALPHEARPDTERPQHEEAPVVEDPQPQAERLAALHAFAQQGNEEVLQEALFDPDPAAQATAWQLLVKQDRQGAIAALIEATKSAQGERRLQALQHLYQSDQADAETVLAALSQTLTDEDIQVKGYAIQALAAWEGADTLAYLHQALHDPDPVVRMLVLQQVAQQDRGLPLLQEALTDADAAVRSLASSLLAGS
jgi:hypothetical protein